MPSHSVEAVRRRDGNRHCSEKGKEDKRKKEKEKEGEEQKEKPPPPCLVEDGNRVLVGVEGITLHIYRQNSDGHSSMPF